MKVFQEPAIELIKFEAADVITTSIDEGDLGGNGTDIG